MMHEKVKVDLASHELRTDYDVREVVDTTALSFSASPSRGVWRKRLEHLGPLESGRVTSIVRYDPGSSFSRHDHPQGEEILVLDGTFSDERGHFGRGTFQLNPPRFAHAPHSDTGCTLFVKLRQYGGTDRPRVLVDTTRVPFVPRGIPGVSSLALYESRAHAESIRLTRLEPGVQAPRVHLPLGEEIFVLEGSLTDEHGVYTVGTWLRMPPGSSHVPSSPDGCLIYVKSGGFPR